MAICASLAARAAVPNVWFLEGTTPAPATATTPIVTISGMQVPVISSVMTTETVGLYQITIQLPANVPTGTPTVQASIGGAVTQSGVTLFVGAQ